MTDRTAKIIPFRLPKPHPPADDCDVHPNLIVPTEIWLEKPKPEPRRRPPAEVIPLPTARPQRPAWGDRGGADD